MSSRLRFCGAMRSYEGFTLLETCVAILVLAALAAAAVPIINSVCRKAEDMTAKASYRTGCGAMDRVWLDVSGRGSDGYIDPDTGEIVDATFMSARQPMIDWYDHSPRLDRGMVDHERGITDEDRKREERKKTNEEILRRWPDFEELPESIFGSILLVTGNELGPDNNDNSRLIIVTICRDRSVLYTCYKQGVVDRSGSFNYDDGLPGDWLQAQ